MKRETVESVVMDLSAEELECFRDYIEMEVKLRDDVTRLETAEKTFIRSIQILNTMVQELQDIMGGNTSVALPENSDNSCPWGQKLN